MSRPESVSELRVRYAETDQMGVVYHTHYLVWCEVGRTDFIRSRGQSYATLERSGIRLVVAEARVRYIDAARYDDEIRVRTRVERVQSRAVTFGYEIARRAGDEWSRIATAETKLLAVDTGGSPRVLPDGLLQRLREGLVTDSP